MLVPVAEVEVVRLAGFAHSCTCMNELLKRYWLAPTTWFYQLQHKLPPKTSELYSRCNFYTVNADNSSCSKNKKGHKYSKYGFFHHGSWCLTPRGSLGPPCKSYLWRSPPGKDHCPQITTTQTNKQTNSVPECCKQWEGSVHRDLYCRNWGPHYCNGETVILVAEAGNVAIVPLHSPAQYTTKLFLVLPTHLQGLIQNLFLLSPSSSTSADWVTVDMITGWLSQRLQWQLGCWGHTRRSEGTGNSILKIN